MEMLLRSAEDTTSKKTVPSMKVFMGDLTLIPESKSHIIYFSSNSGSVNTAIWMHYMDAN